MARRLVSVLSAYSVHDPEVGYCQGMADLAAPFVAVMPDDSEAFWCFERLMSTVRGCFVSGAEAVREGLGSLASVLSRSDPVLMHKLRHIGAGDCLFAYRMLLVRMRRELSLQDVSTSRAPPAVFSTPSSAPPALLPPSPLPPLLHPHLSLLLRLLLLFFRLLPAAALPDRPPLTPPPSPSPPLPHLSPSSSSSLLLFLLPLLPPSCCYCFFSFPPPHHTASNITTHISPPSSLSSPLSCCCWVASPSPPTLLSPLPHRSFSFTQRKAIGPPLIRHFCCPSLPQCLLLWEMLWAEELLGLVGNRETVAPPDNSSSSQQQEHQQEHQQQPDPSDGSTQQGPGESSSGGSSVGGAKAAVSPPLAAPDLFVCFLAEVTRSQRRPIIDGAQNADDVLRVFGSYKVKVQRTMRGARRLQAELSPSQPSRRARDPGRQ